MRDDIVARLRNTRGDAAQIHVFAEAADELELVCEMVGILRTAYDQAEETWARITEENRALQENLTKAVGFLRKLGPRVDDEWYAGDGYETLKELCTFLGEFESVPESVPEKREGRRDGG